MRSFNLYKNTYNTDVAMYPVKVLYIPPKNGYIVKCRWFNIVNPENVFDLGVIDRCFIKKEDINNWKPYEEK